MFRVWLRNFIKTGALIAMRAASITPPNLKHQIYYAITKSLLETKIQAPNALTFFVLSRSRMKNEPEFIIKFIYKLSL